VPRIKAKTVVEHRAAQRRALLDAARELVLEGGPSALSFGELADRTGLARPSVYEYFKTRADLVAALMDEELPRWRSEIEVKLVGVRDPEERIRAFVGAHLELVAAGRHDVAFALGGGDADPATREQIDARHREALSLLADAVASLGLPVETVLPLIGACLSTASAVVRGRPTRQTIPTIVDFVCGGVRAAVASRAPRRSSSPRRVRSRGA